ncbi:fimbrial protein [Enterobacter mori]|uniref:fimbrial protein n=1 Tax=Enterobacter mori TaxID=539813 RepID=UPI000D657B2C|nr:fimbrial protein [Enterobacter mori]MEA5207239.1 fimbrial protein [Enterobacter mori]PWG70494.1 fimbrial protein [Enterobacter mori]
MDAGSSFFFLHEMMNNKLFYTCAMLMLMTAICLFSRPVLALQSCFIEPDNAGTYTTGSSPLLNLSTSKVTSPTNLGVTSTYNIQFLTSNPISCQFWIPTDNSVHFTNAAGELLDGKYTTPEGNALLRTTVPGIDYTVQLMCYVSDGCGSSHPTVDLFLKAGNGTDNSVPTDTNGAPYADADSQWKLKYTLWITPEYKPQKGVNIGHSVPGTIAHFQIRTSSQPLIVFTATSSTLSFTVPASSCSFGVAQGNTVSGNNVSLGDYWKNEINNGNTPVIPFSISLENCYTPKLMFKMTSAFTSSDKTMLGQSNGSAAGVAVKVINTDTSSVMIPNSATSIDIDRSSNWSALGDLNFTAQLLPDGEAIKAGDFNAAATFQMDYE